MTVAEARERFPLVPKEIVQWAVDNISDAKRLELGLGRIDQTKRIELQYSRR